MGAETDANIGSDNWWENEDEPSTGIWDDVSVFSNATEFKTSDNVPDLMTMLKQKQDENAKERERQEEFENEKKRKAGKLHLATRNARKQAQKMGEAVAWWKDSYNRDTINESVDVHMNPLEEMRNVTDWWSSNKDYVPITDDSFDKRKKKAMKIHKVLGHTALTEP